MRPFCGHLFIIIIIIVVVLVVVFVIVFVVVVVVVVAVVVVFAAVTFPASSAQKLLQIFESKSVFFLVSVAKRGRCFPIFRAL